MAEIVLAQFKICCYLVCRIQFPSPSTPALTSPSTMDSLPRNTLSCCLFCYKDFKKLGIHLKHCSKRECRDYSSYLSQKILRKKIPNKSTPCPSCGNLFTRLDTHLRISATCKERKVRSTSPTQTGSTSGSEPVEQPASARPHELSDPKPLPPFKTPQSADLWEEVNSELAKFLAPAVLNAPTVNSKHSILCQGIYDHMVSRFGTRKATRSRAQRRKCHERKLKELRREKNAVKKVLRHARSQVQNEDVVHELSVKFHRLLRLNSKTKKNIPEGQDEFGSL